MPESLADKGIHMFWHVASDIVRYQAFPEIGAAAFVSEDEAAGIHVVALVVTVIEAGVRPCAEDGGESRFGTEKGTAGCKRVHRYENVFSIPEYLEQGFGHERVLEGCDSGTVEMNFSDFLFGKRLRHVEPDILHDGFSADIVRVISLAYEGYTFPALS